MRWLLGLVSLLGLGCLQPAGADLPGEIVGEFDVQGLMVIQSCGTAVDAPDPVDLEFELRLEENTRAFYRSTAGETFAGTVSNDEYAFEATQTWTAVEPDPRIGYAGCTVTQRDTFVFTLDEPDDADADADTEKQDDADLEAQLMTLAGTQATDIEPLDGSDCRPAVAAFGGAFLALPCRVEYALSGTEL